jgi:hypothetical protein
MIRTLGLAAVTVLFCGNAFGFVLLDPPRTWDCAPSIVVDSRGQSSITDSDGGVSATVNALNSNQAWNGAVSNVLNASAGSVASYALGDGVPMLNFQDPINACKGSCLAATFVGFFDERDDGTFRIFDADIVTNARFSWTSTSEGDGCSSEFFIEGVQVHEVGHMLGLGHTDVSGATMFPSVASCNNGPASTEADDNAGIQALYGSSAPGCSGNPGGDPGGGCTAGQKGDSCVVDADCCSEKCKGPSGRKTCK